VKAAEVLTDTTRALAALRAAGLPLDSLELVGSRTLEPGGLAAYRLNGTGITGEHSESLGYARWGTSDHIATTLHRWRDSRAEPGRFGAGVRAIPGLPAALFLMPNDDRLPLLPDVADLARLVRHLAQLPELESGGWRAHEHLSRIDVLHYQPELELAAHVSLGLTHGPSGASRTLETNLRLFADGRTERLLADLHAWRAGGAAAVLPRPLGLLHEGQLYVEEVPAGGTLRDAVRAGGVAPEAVAAAFAALHSANTTFADTRPADGRLVVAHAILRQLRMNDALDDSRIAAVAGPLTAALPAVRALRPVHGGLQPRKIGAGNTGLVFMELEDCAMGDPFDDWGSLIAHFLWESRTEFPEGSSEGAFAARLLSLARATAPERPACELAYFVACALLEIVVSPERAHMIATAEVQLVLQMAREILVAPA
jgi:hypothetical protein